MKSTEKMHFRRAREALNKLSEIDDARVAFIQAANAAVENRYGPQGVSDNTRFVTDVVRRFDEHIEHLVIAEQAKIYTAMFPEDGQ